MIMIPGQSRAHGHGDSPGMMPENLVTQAADLGRGRRFQMQVNHGGVSRLQCRGRAGLWGRDSTRRVLRSGMDVPKYGPVLVG